MSLFSCGLNSDKNTPSEIPEQNMYYFLGRNEVFEHLPNDSDEIIMLGNSLTHNFEWHEMFPNVKIKNRGINGDMTIGILNRLDEILESKPKKIFIEIGINDLMNNIPVMDVISNYEQIIFKIQYQSPGTKVYVQSILPCGLNIYNTNVPVSKSILACNNHLKSISDMSNSYYVDLYTSLVHENELKKIYDCGDHLHLSGAGYIKWCEIIKPMILSN